MGITEIPKEFEYKCDRCGETRTQKNACTDHRPRHWSRLQLRRTAYDGHDFEVGDVTTNHLLCKKCTVDAVKLELGFMTGTE